MLNPRAIAEAGAPSNSSMRGIKQVLQHVPLHNAPFAARPQARSVARGDDPVVVADSFVQFLESGVWVTHGRFRLVAERALLAHQPLHEIKGHLVVRVVADHL